LWQYFAIHLVEYIMTNLGLIDWTMQEPRQVSSDHRTPTADDSSFDRLKEALKERLKPNTDDTIAQIANAPSIQLTDESPIEQPDIALDLPSAPPAPPLAGGWAEAEMSNLRKAVAGPDIDTTRADRNRAIDLRWVLRDIRGNRLKWWPINPHDLRILIIMGLVEMQDNAPVLTSTGASVIE
jgi:hypothetical protein